MIKLEKKKLEGALKNVVAVSGGEVLISQADGFVRLTGDGPSFGVSLTIPTEGESESIEKAIDGKKLFSFLRASIGAECAIDLNSRKFKVGRGSCSFPEKDAGYHFSSEEIVTPGSTVALSAIIPAIEACVVATGTDDTRAWSTGVHFTGELAYGTDGHRLVRATGVVCPELAGTTIPASALLALTKIATGDVEVRIGPGSIEFSGNGFALRSRLISENYPNTEPVFARVEGVESAGFAEGDFQQAVGLISSTGPDAVRMSAADGGITLESLDVTSDSHTVVPIEGGSVGIGDGEIVAVKARYLQSLVGIFGDASRISLGVTGDSEPVVLSSEDAPGVLAIVMPMRV
jgi:DNA polymerase III sliding clamp (beta) subunit (PCNA family)